MLTLIGTIVGSSMFLAAITFIFGLGNRVTTLETRSNDLPDYLELQFKFLSQRLDRIERSMNGFLRKD